MSSMCFCLIRLSLLTAENPEMLSFHEVFKTQLNANVLAFTLLRRKLMLFFVFVSAVDPVSGVSCPDQQDHGSQEKNVSLELKLTVHENWTD